MSEPRATTPDAADPLGLRRCPNCLYDRFGLAAASPCPECGYVVPAGTSVLTLPRSRESRWTVLTTIVVAIILFGFLVRDPIGTVHGFDYFVVVIAVSLIGAGMRWWRVNGSPDAYDCQIWMTPEAIGFERDADRFSTARSVERAMAPLMVVVLIAAMLFPGGALRVSSLGTLCAFAGIFTAIASTQIVGHWKRRGTFSDALDSVAPRLTKWSAIDSIDVDTDGLHALTATMRLKGFLYKHRTIRFAGTRDLIKPIDAAINGFRYRLRAENPTRP